MMFVTMWGLGLCESPAFSRPLTEDTAEAYLGRPWVSHPLAESSPPGLDCTTYVGEALAERYENPGVALNYIRYKDGAPGFFNRNHFMEEMWIPNALRNGIIAPITLPGASESSMEVDLAEWYRDNPEIVVKDAAYYAQANAQKRFTVSIPYISAAQVNEELLKKLPEETVVFFLRRYPESPYRWLLNDNAVMVTHMGFLFGGRRLYHASYGQKQVIREDFSGYLQAHPGVRGVAFYEIIVKNADNGLF
ncbi:MAG: DUF1460 domain-containing protein [Synergistaceae bacterium]|nr:DUF1460 domain-containing protein [Synergistaceae bacterium]